MTWVHTAGRPCCRMRTTVVQLAVLLAMARALVFHRCRLILGGAITPSGASQTTLTLTTGAFAADGKTRTTRRAGLPSEFCGHCFTACRKTFAHTISTSNPTPSGLPSNRIGSVPSLPRPRACPKDKENPMLHHRTEDHARRAESVATAIERRHGFHDWPHFWLSAYWEVLAEFAGQFE